MFLNMAENKDPSDPTKPHPILSDVSRCARPSAWASTSSASSTSCSTARPCPAASELNAGYFQCTDIKAYPYDPEQAKKLLEQAGWVPGPDGIRVAKGAKLAPDGTKLRLKYSTTSGNKLREDSQVLVVEDMKAIGIELYIENAPSSVVIGSWDAGSPRKPRQLRHHHVHHQCRRRPAQPDDEPVGTRRTSRPWTTRTASTTPASPIPRPTPAQAAAAEPDPAKRKACTASSPR